MPGDKLFQGLRDISGVGGMYQSCTKAYEDVQSSLFIDDGWLIRYIQSLTVVRGGEAAADRVHELRLALARRPASNLKF